MSFAGSDVHVKGQDLQLLCFVSAHQPNRLDSAHKQNSKTAQQKDIVSAHQQNRLNSGDFPSLHFRDPPPQI